MPLHEPHFHRQTGISTNSGNCVSATTIGLQRLKQLHILPNEATWQCEASRENPLLC
jgi:hypothetical protein